MIAIRRATRALRIYAHWLEAGADTALGWPASSCEARAIASQRSGTRTDGVARWSGQGEPPPMPHSTRQSPGTRIPRLGSRNHLAAEVHREIGELDHWFPTYAGCLRVTALAPGLPHSAAAAGLRLDVRDYQRVRAEALAWLGRRLSNGGG